MQLQHFFKAGPPSLVTGSRDTSGHVLPVSLQQLPQDRKWCFYTYWPDFVVGSTARKGTLLVTLQVGCTVTDDKGGCSLEGWLTGRKAERPTAED